MFALRRRFRRRDLAWVEEHQELLPHPAQDHKVTAKALLKHEALTGDEILTLIRAARRKSRRRCRTGDPPAFALMARRAARR
jgi:hypothetical protein